jgi:PTS system nitrogen regulatory IIA component
LSAIGITDLVVPERVVAGLRGADKSQLLKELAGRVAPAAGLEAATIYEALAEREALGSTGVGGGIALPHAELPGLKSFVGLFARLERKLDFDAIDGAPVDLVFLLLTPAAAGAEHVRALSSIARRLRDAAVVKRIRQAAGTGEIYLALTA